MLYGITKLDRSTAYKILQTVHGWSREKPILATESCEHTSSTSPFTLVPVSKGNQLFYGTSRSPWDLAHPNNMICWDHSSMGLKNWETLCNSVANFKIYWDSIQQAQYYGIPHNHYSLKKALILATHGVGQWLMRIYWWWESDLYF